MWIWKLGNKNQKAEVRMVEMHTLKRMCGFIRKDRTNVHKRENLWDIDIEEKLKNIIWDEFAHIHILADTRNQKGKDNGYKIKELEEGQEH